MTIKPLFTVYVHYPKLEQEMEKQRKCRRKMFSGKEDKRRKYEQFSRTGIDPENVRMARERRSWKLFPALFRAGREKPFCIYRRRKTFQILDNDEEVLIADKMIKFQKKSNNNKITKL